MLILNPVYKELFRLGYKGRENTYMYWTRNEKQIIEHLEKSRPDLLRDPEIMRAFYAKLRWRSPIGMLLAFEIGRVLPKLSRGRETDLTEISVEYGKKMYSIEDFGKLHPVPEKGLVEPGKDKYIKALEASGTDLRGLSLYCLEMNKLKFMNIDFSYAVFNCSELNAVTFSGCVMKRMEIRRSELVECVFSKTCKMLEVNFSDTLIDAQILCDNIRPVISRLRKKDIRKILIGYNSRWRGFTEIRGASFSKMASDPELEKYIERKQATLLRVYEIYDRGVLERGIALAKTFIK